MKDIKLTHDTIIYVIVGIIICIQLFFFLKNFKKIINYKNIIVNTDNLSVVELRIEEDKISNQDPDYLIDNKVLYTDKESLYDRNTREEIEETETPDEYDENISINEDDDEDEDDDEINLFS